MRTILHTMAAASLAVALSACALLSGVLPQSADDKMKVAAEASLHLIKDGWIPGLAAYRSTQQCGSPAVPPCWDANVYAKLWWATDAVTLCMQAATRTEITLADFDGCKRRFDAARASFANSGVAIKEPTP